MQSSLDKIAEFIHQQIEIFGDEMVLSGRETGTESDEESNTETIENVESLQDLYEMIHTCTGCALGAKRNKVVFGNGNTHADIMLVGEAPGADEDRTGSAFVGRAGELLDKILAAIDLSRDKVFITNILKCRPPLNRDPLPEEIKACLPYLYKQIDIIQPKLILCLGRVAAQALLKSNCSMSELRQKVHLLNNRRCLVTYHPAALLRNTHYKRPTWEDVKLLKRLYDEKL